MKFFKYNITSFLLTSFLSINAQIDLIPDGPWLSNKNGYTINLNGPKYYGTFEVSDADYPAFLDWFDSQKLCEIAIKSGWELPNLEHFEAMYEQLWFSNKKFRSNFFEHEANERYPVGEKKDYIYQYDGYWCDKYKDGLGLGDFIYCFETNAICDNKVIFTTNDSYKVHYNCRRVRFIRKKIN